MSSSLFTALCFTCAFCLLRRERMQLECDAQWWTRWSDNDDYEPLHGPDALWLPHRSAEETAEGRERYVGFLGPYGASGMSVWNPVNAILSTRPNFRTCLLDDNLYAVLCKMAWISYLLIFELKFTCSCLRLFLIRFLGAHWVGIAYWATGWTIQGSISARAIPFCSPKHLDRLWGAPRFLVNQYRVPFPEGWDMRFTAHLLLVPRLRMSGALPPFSAAVAPLMPSSL
jgi:hypothetical protein